MEPVALDRFCLLAELATVGWNWCRRACGNGEQRNTSRSSGRSATAIALHADMSPLRLRNRDGSDGVAMSVWLRGQHTVDDLSATRQIQLGDPSTAHLTRDQWHAVPDGCPCRPRHLVLPGTKHFVFTCAFMPTGSTDSRGIVITQLRIAIRRQSFSLHWDDTLQWSRWNRARRSANDSHFLVLGCDNTRPKILKLGSW